MGLSEQLAGLLRRGAAEAARRGFPQLERAIGPNPYVWRLGFHTAPLEYPPREFCAWNHRFDDPEHEYRTLYCAERTITCIREVLADLRPNAKARTDFAQFQANQSTPPKDPHRPARTVSVEWRATNALARATVDREGELYDLRQARRREELTDRHAGLLAEHGMPYLDMTQITAENRIVTQTISRDLFELGVAGILFSSNRDNANCIALVEGRATLQPAGDPVPLTEDLPELLQVCSEYGLILKRPDGGEASLSGWTWRP